MTSTTLPPLVLERGSRSYVILIYYQPSTFTPPDDLAAPDTPVAMFDFPAYVQSSGLGPLLAVRPSS
jgi:hypothetical protein